MEAPAQVERHAHSHAGHVHVHPTSTSDLLGQALSLLCLVHCLATPLVLLIAPAVAHLMGGWHPVLLVGVALTALWAFIPGYRHHHKIEVLVLGGIGVTLMSIGALGFEGSWLDPVLTVSGGMLMLAAHWRNRRLNAACAVH